MYLKKVDKYKSDLMKSGMTEEGIARIHSS